MSIFEILELILGVSLFLFGMSLMSESLKSSVGGGLKDFLAKATSSKLKGFLLGAVVTAIIQSSSAVTVMVVGFVNSGAMLLSQTVGVIMGANVGTAVTSWLTALSGLEGASALGSALQWFKPSVFTPVLALIGLVLYMAAKTDVKKSVGVIFLGFSVLMLGMDTMSGAVSGLSENEAFRSILLKFENPIFGLLAGMVLTAIVQSSSASIGILQSLTATGAITFGNAIPIIMGQNIGTCVTALIASVGTNKNARRASVIHLSFNVIGSALGIAVLMLLKYGLRAAFLSGSMDMWGIAAVHTVFNLLSFLVLFPVSGILERIARTLVRDGDGEEGSEPLDERLLQTPTVAASRAKELTSDMGRMALEALGLSCDMLINGYDTRTAERVNKLELSVDSYEDKIGGYFVKISAKSISDRDNGEIGAYLHMLGDIERICDHAQNLCEAAKTVKDKGIELSPHTAEELNILVGAVNELYSLSLDRESDIYSAEALEDVVDGLCFEVKRRNIDRLQKNINSTEQSFILNDILTDLERVGDHSVNIAQCMNEIGRGEILELHRRKRDVRADTGAFAQMREHYSKKYCLDIKK